MCFFFLQLLFNLFSLFSLWKKKRHEFQNSSTVYKLNNRCAILLSDSWHALELVLSITVCRLLISSVDQFGSIMGRYPLQWQGCPLAAESGQHTDRACVCRRLHPDRRGCSHDAGGLPRMLWSHSGVSVSAGDSKWLIIYFIFLLNISAPL